MLRAVGHDERRDEAQHDRRDAFNDVQPLPAVQPGNAFQAQKHAGHRRAEGVGDRLGQDEDAQDGHALRGGEPEGQVEQDGREESGFGRTQQEADDVEGGLAVDQEHGGGEDAPADQDAGDPLAGAVAVHAAVAGDFQQGVAEEEDAGAETVGGFGEADVALHAKFGEADVVAVQIGDEVQQDDQRHEPAADLAERGLAQFTERRGAGQGGHRGPPPVVRVPWEGTCARMKTPLAGGERVAVRYQMSDI